MELQNKYFHANYLYSADRQWGSREEIILWGANILWNNLIDRPHCVKFAF